jgi:serine/threonine protein kinase
MGAMDAKDFFAATGPTESQRYKLTEVIGKGSYGVVAAAVDQFSETGERVAIKKITNVFDHVSDATRILREIKLLRLLRHPDIVEIRHIMLPPSARDFRDIYVVFELLETDLHQVIKANDDLTPEHHQFFLYQMLRGLKYIHSAKVRGGGGAGAPGRGPFQLQIRPLCASIWICIHARNLIRARLTTCPPAHPPPARPASSRSSTAT